MSRLYDLALEAIKELFSDTSVSKEETQRYIAKAEELIIDLNTLKEEIDMMILTLKGG